MSLSCQGAKDLLCQHGHVAREVRGSSDQQEGHRQYQEVTGVREEGQRPREGGRQVRHLLNVHGAAAPEVHQHRAAAQQRSDGGEDLH